jgi:TPR repeat protein
VQAANYYERAADRNHVRAQVYYGMYLAAGWGVQRDLTKAAQYIKLAADQHHAQAQLIYGALLERGIGIAGDLVESAKYAKLAADQNEAQARLLRMGPVFKLTWSLLRNTTNWQPSIITLRRRSVTGSVLRMAGECNLMSSTRRDISN